MQIFNVTSSAVIWQSSLTEKYYEAKNIVLFASGDSVTCELTDQSVSLSEFTHIAPYGTSESEMDSVLTCFIKPCTIVGSLNAVMNVMKICDYLLLSVCPVLSPLNENLF